MEWPITVEELDTFVAWLIEKLCKEMWQEHRYMPEPGMWRLASDNAMTGLKAAIRDVLTQQERYSRLDEHRILAGLDEEGWKRRYVELGEE